MAHILGLRGLLDGLYAISSWKHSTTAVALTHDMAITPGDLDEVEQGMQDCHHMMYQDMLRRCPGAE